MGSLDTSGTWGQAGNFTIGPPENETIQLTAIQEYVTKNISLVAII
jgi:hypothetical protein